MNGWSEAQSRPAPKWVFLRGKRQALAVVTLPLGSTFELSAKGAWERFVLQIRRSPMSLRTKRGIMITCVLGFAPAVDDYKETRPCNEDTHRL